MALKKTALLIDEDLVRQCKAILGTKTTTQTISEAMMEVIRIQGRARHLERLRRREGLDLGDQEVMKGARRSLGDAPR